MVAAKTRTLFSSDMQRLSGEKLLLLRVQCGANVSGLVDAELDRRAVGLKPHRRHVPRRLNRRRFAA